MPMLALAFLGVLALIVALDRHGLYPARLLRSDPLALGVLPALFVFVWVPNFLAVRASGSGSWLVDCWQCDKWERLARGIQRFGEFGEVVIRPLSFNLLLFLGAALLVFRSVRRDLGATKFIWAPLLITAPAFAVVHAMTLRPEKFFADRYLVFLPVGLAVYFAIALAGLGRGSGRLTRPRRAAVLVTLVAVVAIASGAMASAVKAQARGTYLADWRSVAEHIEAIEAEGDLIVTIDTRPFDDQFRFGFDIAADRYYDGSLSYVTPNSLIDSPASGLDAGRYHFVLFVPRLAENWEFREGWISVRFSGMRVVTTTELQSPAGRIGAWWELTQQLRSDVAVRSQIAGAAMQSEAGLELYPWIEVATVEAGRLGESRYAETLISTIGGE